MWPSWQQFPQIGLSWSSYCFVEFIRGRLLPTGPVCEKDGCQPGEWAGPGGVLYSSDKTSLMMVFESCVNLRNIWRFFFFQLLWFKLLKSWVNVVPIQVSKESVSSCSILVRNSPPAAGSLQASIRCSLNKYTIIINSSWIFIFESCNWRENMLISFCGCCLALRNCECETEGVTLSPCIFAKIFSAVPYLL